ncbi:hypothetical protein A3J90_08785 [candidate division WOR-1 bacterium RIFOXYC2_FULL_37_10]|uniref:DUF362 domain-containing protein n=1 Tax=candidate division WOR-1 bacterium RIFOXYB2_FULL_37_13 TaxID=1802579 RepID=A0A1F4SNR0_UNCSA|nr:MAG: hypothetical protein A2310_07065 [candidate division WOR-1 bacterium RIFOXYB2_FULL_37_13]OGC33068.1 MAG: hypothetical protein A3J90_08785 [candidate division WOR-1 bacterium RIFOXYC2_FULL_37_10]
MPSISVCPKVFTASTPAGIPPQTLQAHFNRGFYQLGITPATLGRSVLITPNLCGPGLPEHHYSMTSRDAVVAAVQLIRSFGVEEIGLAAHPADYVAKLEMRDQFFDAIGIRSLASELGFKFYDLGIEGFEEREGIFVSSVLNRYETILNIMPPKTHHQSVVSLALKNIGMGCTDHRSNMHESLTDAVVRANIFIRQERNVIDIVHGGWGQEENGPHFGIGNLPGDLIKLYGR